jgi:hypothetical protein
MDPQHLTTPKLERHVSSLVSRYGLATEPAVQDELRAELEAARRELEVRHGKRTSRHLQALAGVYRRMDSGELTGRNAELTSSTLEHHWRELRAALEAGGFEYLDSHPRLAATWARVERRHLLGPENRGGSRMDGPLARPEGR